MLFRLSLFITICYYACCVFSSKENSCLKSQRSCKYVDEIKRENFNSFVYTEPGGRLGNHILGYALIYQLHKELGFKGVINNISFKTLTSYFTKETVGLDVLDEYICDLENVPWEYFNGHLRDLINDSKYLKNKFLLLFPNIHNEEVAGYKPEDHESVEHKNIVGKFYLEFPKRAKFIPRIKAAVDSSLNEIRTNFKSKGINDIQFVGIHNRRTDHLKYTRENFDLEPIDVEYFVNGIEYFREELPNPVFIYASDDMEWGYENLEKYNKGDIFFIGLGESSSNPEASVYDFTLLSSTNSTIVGRGTFACFVAMMAGGESYGEYGPINFDVSNL